MRVCDHKTWEYIANNNVHDANATYTLQTHLKTNKP